MIEINRFEKGPIHFYRDIDEYLNICILQLPKNTTKMETSETCLTIGSYQPQWTYPVNLESCRNSVIFYIG